MSTTAVSTGARLAAITIAVTDMDRMARFYREVLGLELRLRRMGPFELITANLNGLELQLCPREVAGITAEQNRHQLRFVVPDVERALRAAKEAHGTLMEHNAVRDPDGNSIELVKG
ncbi:MAG: VOC family protein [Planctomycetota bacterium]